jgi:hypothetical protein
VPSHPNKKKKYEEEEEKKEEVNIHISKRRKSNIQSFVSENENENENELDERYTKKRLRHVTTERKLGRSSCGFHSKMSNTRGPRKRHAERMRPTKPAKSGPSHE